MVDIAEERARIARELHDTIAQDLAAIGYALDSEIGRSDTHPQSREALRAIREEITTLNSTVRTEIFRLRTARSQEPQRNLEEELESFARDFKIIGTLPNDEIGVELCKVLLELARNAIAHGGASVISLEITPEFVTFANNGESSAPMRDTRFGLVGISERLANIGWDLVTTAGFNRIEIHRVP